jgi:hypothetical protein
MMQDGMTCTQASKSIGVERKTVNRRRDKDPALDDRLLAANKLGTVCLNDAILVRYEGVMRGEETWTKEQAAAMRDMSQHVRWLSTRLYPRLYGDKTMAQISQTGNGQITLAWLSTGTTDAGNTDQAPQLIEDLSSSS